jgi:class 3 adenylate cyclase
MTSQFRRLLEQLAQATGPQARARVEAEIRAAYERELGVLISDMSGFSRITREEGILHFLALIHQMQSFCIPAIEGAGGRLVKAEADNLYAAFDTPAAALAGAVAMHDACDRACAGRARNDIVSLSIGIDYGPVLDLDGADYFGDAVNIASKLGEDVAEGGELLITERAAAGLAKPVGWRSESRRTRISAVDIDYLAFTRDAPLR